MVKIKASKSCKLGKQVELVFSLSQHKRDLNLLNSIIKYLNCGHLEINDEISVVVFRVYKIKDIQNKIIPGAPGLLGLCRGIGVSPPFRRRENEEGGAGPPQINGVKALDFAD